MLGSATSRVDVHRERFADGDVPTRGHKFGKDHRQQDEGSAQVATAPLSTCFCEQPKRDSMDAERVSPARLLPEIFIN